MIHFNSQSSLHTEWLVQGILWIMENPLEERSPEEEALVEQYIERLDRKKLMREALIDGESLLLIIFIFE